MAAFAKNISVLAEIRSDHLCHDSTLPYRYMAFLPSSRLLTFPGWNRDKNSATLDDVNGLYDVKRD
jgi:hypothetical protein